MLYDPKWEIELKADPFALENLIAWLETKPREETYSWDDGSECMLGQWLKTIDPTVECKFDTGNLYLYKVHGASVNLEKFEKIAKLEYDWDTFGAALERARAALASNHCRGEK
jgi:hypothetical protein